MSAGGSGGVPDGFRVRRIYEAPAADDGQRVLVDRLWPRGVSKERAELDRWAKEVAPSADLRTWFHVKPDERHDEFVRRYRAELDGEEQQAGLETLRRAAAGGPVTLLTATRDPATSHVAVLLTRLRTD